MNTRNTSSRWPDAPRVRAECPDDGGRYLLNPGTETWTCEKPHPEEDGWKVLHPRDLDLEAGEFPESAPDGDGACVLWIVTPEPDDLDDGDAAPSHVCSEHPVPYVSDGPLGHGWECGICGAFLQAG